MMLLVYLPIDMVVILVFAVLVGTVSCMYKHDNLEEDETLKPKPEYMPKFKHTALAHVFDSVVRIGDVVDNPMGDGWLTVVDITDSHYDFYYPSIDLVQPYFRNDQPLHKLVVPNFLRWLRGLFIKRPPQQKKSTDIRISKTINPDR